MKAVGFFCVVFLSMLAVFLVGTGEIGRWLNSAPKDDLRVTVREADPNDGASNTIHFDFWNVHQGRRNFTISAALPPEGIADGSRIDKLEDLRLEDGIIEIPLYDAKELRPDGEGPALRELLLDFRRAIYEREGGLVRGTGTISVLLEDGRGTTNEGTEFFFEKLHFRNDPAAPTKNHFVFDSDRPVSVVSPFLEVYSPTGLRGRIDEVGIESLEFLPPVFTYLDPRAAKGLTAEPSPASGKESGKPTNGTYALPDGALPDGALPDGAPAGERELNADPARVVSQAKDDEHVVVTCAGPLRILFRREGTAELRQEDRPTHVTFERDVVVYARALADAASRRRSDYRPPAPEASRFDCQELRLDIDDRGATALPTRAVATWNGERVRARIVEGERTYSLDGDRLVWNRLPDSVAIAGAPFASEAVITGQPRLEGPEVNLVAERALFRPERDQLRLEDVTGQLRVEREKSEDGSKPDSGRELEIDADVVDASFAAVDGGPKTLARVIARSDSAQGVRVRSAESPDEARFIATGRVLDYDASSRVAALTGSAGTVPRLEQGESWIQAPEIRFSLAKGPRVVRFLHGVSGRLSTDELAAAKERKSKEKSEAADTAAAPPREGAAPRDGGLASVQRPSALEIAAQSLDVQLSASNRIEGADAFGTVTDPVSIRALSGPKSRFFAPHVRLLEGGDIIELSAGPDAPPDALARLERERAVVTARTIRLHVREWRCELRDQVTVRLFRGENFEQNADLLVEASSADVSFFEDLQPPTRSNGNLLRELDSVRALTARGSDGAPLFVRAEGITLRGETAIWDASTRQLTVSGEGLQEIRVDHEELRGPIVAREIIFDEPNARVILQTAVHGQLHQTAHRGESGAEASGPAMPWEFETHRLEIYRSADGKSLSSLVARDKVLIFNTEKAILLRGDDLEYDHARRRMRVFSRDGRRQTLQRFRKGFDAREPVSGGERDEDIDTIDAEEIIAYLYENPHAPQITGSPLQMLLVQFRRNVMANFIVEESDRVAAGSSSKEPWQLICEQLTLHVDPQASNDPARVIPWAFASSFLPDKNGGRTRGSVTIRTGDYEARAETVEYHAGASRLVLAGSPATISDRRPRAQTAPDQRAPVIAITKMRAEVRVQFLPRPPQAEPWPGVPRILEEP